MLAPRRLPVTKTIDGEACWVYCDPATYRSVPNFEPQDGDIIQVTFPRSGTSWVQQIVQLILYQGQSATSYAEFLERAPVIELHGLKTTQLRPRLLRTHFPMSKIRVSPRAKYIYVARNPWDCCVSCFHMIKEHPAFQFQDGTFDEFLDAFLGGQFGSGDYFDHVISGHGHREDPNVFFVTYEELQRDKAAVVLKLAYFLGHDHGRRLERDASAFEEVLYKSTTGFMSSFMKTNPADIRKRSAQDPTALQAFLMPGVGKASEESLINMLRKGTVGDWREHFSTDDVMKMQAKIDEKAAGSDIVHIWQHD
uniref:Putative sulfotransferase n=1 Tax=Ixodes ricinus TaxID=34613 RepID=V5HMU1_IXORI